MFDYILMPSVKELREKYEKEQQESKKNIIFQPMAVPRKSI